MDVDEKRENVRRSITDLLQVIPVTGSEARACNSPASSIHKRVVKFKAADHVTS